MCNVLNNVTLYLLFLLLTSAICSAQSSYNGLTPGKSTRPEVERLLGPPVKEHSKTLVEYSPQRATGRIFVQYAPGTAVVERFEFLCRTQNSSCDDLIRGPNLSLAESSYFRDVWTADPNGTIVRYYGPPQNAAMTVDNESGGSYYALSPARVALYSAELYKAATTTADEAAKNDPTQLTVRSLRFFEADTNSLPLEQRAYRRRFSGEGTRFVSYEIMLAYPKNKLGRPITITSVWSRDGPMQPVRIVLDNNYDSAETYRIFNQGLGKDDGRGFSQRKGNWKVEIYIEGQLVATGTFEIY